MTDDLKEFILQFFKSKGKVYDDITFNALQGDGSKRLFFRITPAEQDQSVIVMESPPIDSESMRENIAYLKIGRHLKEKGIPVPEIYQYNLENGWFIMQDMGETSLQEWVSSEKNLLPIYENVLNHLFLLQTKGVNDFDPSWCCQTEKYDNIVMRQYESDYFRAAFLHLYLGLKKDWPELEAPFIFLADKASNVDSNFFLHRDFQSRNIMFSKGNMGIIDWQGGRIGPLGYDLASLLIDPYTALSAKMREDLYEMYLLLLKDHNAEWVGFFKRSFPYLAIQRNLQILGAFSYLTKKRDKQYFEEYIPTALRTLHDLVHQVNDRELYPLRDLLDELRV
ncbi:MAG: phosphotransferase [Desulfobacterales bacterium]|nr:phosphotransferase [Desulfobacterales bacterium]